MLSVNYREALIADVPALARIRAAQWETEQYWARRISGYMEGTLHPHHAFRSRALLVAVEGEMVVGLVAGHLTSRFGVRESCSGSTSFANEAGSGSVPKWHGCWHAGLCRMPRARFASILETCRPAAFMLGSARTI